MTDDSIKYEYSLLPSAAGVWAKQPLVEIVLTDGRVYIPQLAMVDSGAYMTMVDDEIMDKLKIDRNSCKKMMTGGIVGASVESFLAEITIRVDKFDASIRIPVLFVPKLKTNMLLGQAGFFENFDVCFENGKNAFYLSKSKKKKL